MLDAAGNDDPLLSRGASRSPTRRCVVHDRDRTTLSWRAPLQQRYDRATVRVNANVAPATHGETSARSSAAATPPSPTSASRSSRARSRTCAPTRRPGGASTSRCASTTRSGRRRRRCTRGQPRDRVYASRIDDDGATHGDLRRRRSRARGCRPARTTSARAYRKGLGAAGNVRAGQLTKLMTRPLGVTARDQPGAGDRRGGPGAARRRARTRRCTVLTLDRAVSLRDYEDFARAFAGIAKAHAMWVADGPARGVHPHRRRAGRRRRSAGGTTRQVRCSARSASSSATRCCR